MESIIYELENIDNAAKQFLTIIGDAKKITLTGDLGAGKTTFVKAICRQLNVIDETNSPTFSIINEYQSTTNTLIYHIDLYRIKSEEEAIHLGIEDYIYNDAYCFIEWPEVIMNILPERHIKIRIENITKSSRKILFL